MATRARHGSMGPTKTTTKQRHWRQAPGEHVLHHGTCAPGRPRITDVRRRTTRWRSSCKQKWKEGGVDSSFEVLRVNTNVGNVGVWRNGTAFVPRKLLLNVAKVGHCGQIPSLRTGFPLLQVGTIGLNQTRNHEISQFCVVVGQNIMGQNIKGYCFYRIAASFDRMIVHLLNKTCVLRRALTLTKAISLLASAYITSIHRISIRTRESRETVKIDVVAREVWGKSNTYSFWTTVSM